MASNSEKHRLISQAQARAYKLGGLIALLLSGKRDDIGWSSRYQQFTIAGKPIGVTVIRREINSLEGQLAKIIAGYLQNLVSGTWDLKRWESEMIKLLEDTHSIFGALAVGGLITAVSYPILFSRIDRDTRYISGFRRDLRAERLAPGSRRASLRGVSYIRSAYVTYSELELRGHTTAGFTEAINVTRALESCHTRLLITGCVELSNRGWIDIAQMVPVGSRVCNQWCRCYIAYR